MKILFYLLLPYFILWHCWLVLLIGTPVVFFMPGKWWRVSPAIQKDRLIGKLLPFLNISLRNLTFRLFALAAFFIFLPNILAIPFFFICMLPIMIVTRVFSRDPQKRETPLLGAFLICCFVVLLTAGLLAPMNLIPIALYFLMGRPAGNFIEFLAVGPDAVRDDIYMGLLGILVVSLLLLLDAFWRLRQARQVENLPTSKAGSVSLGLAELKGIARKAGDPRYPILELRMELFDYLEPHQKLEPFFLEDDTGKILVNPDRCRIRTGWITDLTSLFFGYHEVVLNGRVQRDERIDAVTRTLMDGDPVYVIGNTEVNPEKADATGAERLLVRPSAMSAWNPSLWRFLFGSAAMPAARDIFNVFFLSDTREEIARKHILRGFKTVWLISFFWFCASLFLIWSSYWPVRQDVSLGGWRNATWRGGDSERLLRFEKYVENLSPPTQDAIPALVEAIGYEDRRYKEPATWALIPMIPSIDDRAAEVVSLLRSNLQTTDAHLLQTTILALGAFGRRAEPAIPELIKQLRCESTNTYEVTPAIIRFQAASALGKIGPAADEAIPALTGALSDRNPAVRNAAQQALQKISPSLNTNTPPPH